MRLGCSATLLHKTNFHASSSHLRQGDKQGGGGLITKPSLSCQPFQGKMTLCVLPGSPVALTDGENANKGFIIS